MYTCHYMILNCWHLLQGEETQVVDPRVIHVMLAADTVDEVLLSPL